MKWGTFVRRINFARKRLCQVQQGKYEGKHYRPCNKKNITRELTDVNLMISYQAGTSGILLPICIFTPSGNVTLFIRDLVQISVHVWLPLIELISFRSLSENKIQQLPAGIFFHLPDLKWLYVSLQLYFIAIKSK